MQAHPPSLAYYSYGIFPSSASPCACKERSSKVESRVVGFARVGLRDAGEASKELEARGERARHHLEWRLTCEDRRISDLLVPMRHRFSLTILILIAGASALVAQQDSPPAPQAQEAQQPAPTPAPQALPPTQAAPTTRPAVAPLRRGLSVVVLDPAHGGADPGARGSSGALEKDAVLRFARAARVELAREGLRVVMTRDGDQNPSFDERSATGNAPRGAVFLSFHVSSTGQPGTVRAYSFDPGTADNSAGAPAGGEHARTPTGLREWDEAQKPLADLSRRLADLLQVQLAQRFSNSPEISSSFAVRGLRSVTAPAVAIEVSSVSVEDPKSLERMASPLAAAVAHAVMDFRPVYEAAKE